MSYIMKNNKKISDYDNLQNQINNIYNNFDIGSFKSDEIVHHVDFVSETNIGTFVIPEDGFYSVRCSTGDNPAELPFVRLAIGDSPYQTVIFECHGISGNYKYMFFQPHYFKAGSKLAYQHIQCELIIYKYIK